MLNGTLSFIMTSTLSNLILAFAHLLKFCLKLNEIMGKFIINIVKFRASPESEFKKSLHVFISRGNLTYFYMKGYESSIHKVSLGTVLCACVPACMCVHVLFLNTYFFQFYILYEHTENHILIHTH